MTSKKSFPKFVKFTLKKQIWLPLLYFVILFFACCVPLLIQLQDRGISTLPDSVIADIISRYFTNSFHVLTVLMPLFALFSSIAAFSYLQSRPQVDLYHSLPAKRTELFWNSYFSGILYFLLPFAAMELIAFIIIASCGHISLVSFGSAITSIGMSLLYYFVFFSVCSLAGILSGKKIVHAVLSVFILIFPLALYLLYEFYMEHFFLHFIDIDFWTRLKYLCPVVNQAYFEKTAGNVLYLLAIAVICTVLAVLLYRRRKSEQAGSIIVFKPFASVLKFACVLLATLAFGAFFSLVGDNTPRDAGFWMYFGLVSGAVLSHLVIEVIYQMDIKAIFRNAKSLAVYAVIFFACFLSFFAFDLTKYDAFLPDAQEVKAASISFENLENYESNENAMTKEYRRLRDSKYEAPEQKQAIINIAKAGIDAHSEGGYSYHDVYTLQYTVRYTMNNGRTVTRRYYGTETREIEKDFAVLYDSQTYKDVTYRPIQEVMSYTGFNIIDGPSGADLAKDINSSQLLPALYQDLMNSKFSDIAGKQPKYILNLSEQGNGRRYYYDIGYPVYDSFHNTLAVLEQYDLGGGMENVSSISVNLDSNQFADDERRSYAEPSITITDADTIASIYRAGMMSCLYKNSVNGFCYDYQLYFDCSVSYHNGNTKSPAYFSPEAVRIIKEKASQQ